MEHAMEWHPHGKTTARSGEMKCGHLAGTRQLRAQHGMLASYPYVFKTIDLSFGAK